MRNCQRGELLCPSCGSITSQHVKKNADLPDPLSPLGSKPTAAENFDVLTILRIRQRASMLLLESRLHQVVYDATTRAVLVSLDPGSPHSPRHPHSLIRALPITLHHVAMFGVCASPFWP